MCGRTIVVSKIEVIEKTYNVTIKPNQLNLFKANYNLSVGQYAPVITCEEPADLQMYKFGLTPSWAKKQMYLFNARSEGDGNKDDDPNYTGGMGIITKPSFLKPIRSKRCLVIVDAFYEGSKNEGLSKPYLVYVRNRKPIALAGIYDTWADKETGEVINSFSIITTVANELLHSIGHHRSPVILPKSAERIWISENSTLSDITSLLKPYPTREMNAYPVSPEVKSFKNNSIELLQPIGNRVYPETEVRIVDKPNFSGKRRNKSGSPDDETFQEYNERKRKEEEGK